jgi:uncharacterized protein YecE (DUF72 family)
LDDVLAGGDDVYCYFNNDFFGHAVGDARYLRTQIGSKPAADRSNV